MNIENGVFLALRGGGVRTAVGIGTIKALEEFSIPIKGISGASMGAIAACLLAYGYKANDIIRLFKEYDMVLTKGALFLLGKGSKVVEESLEKEIGKITFNDLKTDIYINASYNNEFNPKMFIFSKETTPNETLVRAARASSTLQPIYGYYITKIDNKIYNFFDGGFTANPYIPKDINIPIIYSTFLNKYEPKPITNWQRTPVKAEELSDIVIKPYIGTIGIVGLPDKMQQAYEYGYEEASQTLKKILK